MSKDLKNLIDTVEETESSHSELEQEVKLLKEDIKRLNFTVNEQKLLIREQERKILSSEVFELPGDVQILKDMLISQRQEIKKRDRDVEILEQDIDELTSQLRKGKAGGGTAAENEDLIKAKKLIVQLTEENELFLVNENNAKELIENLTKEKESYREEMEALKAETLTRDLHISEEVSKKSEPLEIIKTVNGGESLKLEVESLKNKVSQLKQRLKTADTVLEKPITQEKELSESIDNLEILEVENQKLHRDLNTAKLTINNLVDEVNNHLKEIAEQGEGIRERNIKISVLNEKVESSKRRIMELSEELLDVSDLSTSSLETDEISDTEIKESEDLIKKLQEENLRLSERISELEEVKLSEHRDLDTYEKNDLEELISYLKNENLQLRKSIIELRESKPTPMGKIEAREHSFNELIAINKNILEENEQLNAAILELKKIKNLPSQKIRQNIKFDHSTPRYYQNVVFLRLLNSLDKYKRELIIDSLIQDLARTSNLDMKRFIIDLLSEIKDERRIRDTFIQMISSEDWLIRLHLVKALSKFDAIEIKGTLETLLNDADLDVRDAAKEALRKIS
jgi:chromosome segregation ATPase